MSMGYSVSNRFYGQCQRSNISYGMPRYHHHGLGSHLNNFYAFFRFSLVFRKAICQVLRSAECVEAIKKSEIKIMAEGRREARRKA